MYHVLLLPPLIFSPCAELEDSPNFSPGSCRRAELSSRTSSPFLEEIEVIDHAFDLA
jgi:hypothetical protein